MSDTVSPKKDSRPSARSLADHLIKPSHSGFAQMVKFGMAGACATVADLAIRLPLFAHAHLPIWQAVGGGYLAGTVVSYLLSITSIFPHRSVKDKRVEFPIFAALSAIGYLLNTSLVYLLVRAMERNPLASRIADFFINITASVIALFSSTHVIRMDNARFGIASAVAIVIVFFFNFFSRKFLLFRKPKES